MINSTVAEPSGFNCKARRASRVISGARKPCFESHSLPYFKPRGYRFEAFNSLMRIRFLYYNCLGFDLASDYTDIVLNTV